MKITDDRPFGVYNLDTNKIEIDKENIDGTIEIVPIGKIIKIKGKRSDIPGEGHIRQYRKKKVIKAKKPIKRCRCK